MNPDPKDEEWEIMTSGKSLMNYLRPPEYIKVIDNYRIYSLKDFKIGEDSISGNLVNFDADLQEVAKFFVHREKEGFTNLDMPRKLRRTFRSTLFLNIDAQLSEGPYAIDLADIGIARRYKPNYGADLLAMLGGSIVFSALLVAAACNCPRVYATDSTGNPAFEGTLFPGAMAKSFERDDIIPLYNLSSSGNNGELNLSLVNELPEDEYINELKLYKYAYRSDYKIAHDEAGNLFEYKDLLLPYSATANEGTNVQTQVAEIDDQTYDFSGYTEPEEFNSVELTFDKSELDEGPLKLVIYGRQSEWLEQAAGYFFQLHGSDLDRLNNRMDKIPQALYERNLAKIGISMNAFIKTKRGWQKIGTYQNAGILKQKHLGLDIDPDMVEGESIEIRLESAFRFWEIDQVGITQDWYPMDDFVEIPLHSAVRNAQEDVASQLESSDKAYVNLPEKGNKIDLVFHDSTSTPGIYMLKGSGYYYHDLDLDTPADRKTIRELRSAGRMSAHYLSKALFEAMILAEGR